ncbi:hypothetical protein EI94DRAFT_733634 [Lactarius quietus]|nr:hypothetical protein EI94DRAFT_733634 [Lactarius quietus]
MSPYATSATVLPWARCFCGAIMIILDRPYRQMNNKIARRVNFIDASHLGSYPSRSGMKNFRCACFQIEQQVDILFVFMFTLAAPHSNSDLSFVFSFSFVPKMLQAREEGYVEIHITFTGGVVGLSTGQSTPGPPSSSSKVSRQVPVHALL